MTGLRHLPDDHFWVAGRNALTELLLDRHGAEGPLLDAGSGPGEWSRTLGSRGWTTWVDSGPVAPGGVRGSVTRLPFRDGAFATVLARDVLEHVDDDAMLGEIARVLSTGGLLLATVPGWPSLWGPRDERAGHLRRYRRSDLRSALGGAGLDVVSLQGYQTLLLPLVVVARRTRRRPGSDEAEEQLAPRVNRLLRQVNLFETRLPAALKPTGSSLAVVARKP